MIKFFKKLNAPQKFFIYIIFSFGVFITYCLSSVILTFIYMPEVASHKNKIKHIFQLIHSAYDYFSLKTPYLALMAGEVKTTIFAFLVALFIIFILSLLIAGLLVIAQKQRKERELHGTAKWSTINEIKSQKLMETDGILVGLYDEKPLFFGGQEFCALGAPTRSNKGTGVVIPNLMCWKNSLVQLDIKQECFDYTSKYRQDILGQEVFLFNPFSEQTHRYNPLLYLDFNDPKVELQIQNIANSFYISKDNDFFVGEGKSIFIAITYLFGVFYHNGYLADDYTLTNIGGALNGINILRNGQKEKISLELATETAYLLSWLPDTIYNLFLSFFSQKEAEKQFAGVKTAYETALKPFQNRVIKNSTSQNDFDFRDLRRKKMTIYLVINPEDLVSARPILNLFFTQLIDTNISQGLPDQNPELKHSCLLCMDEFTSIGYMEKYEVSVSFIAGYDLRSLIIYQADSQIKNDKPLGYGEKGGSTLLQNHTCNIFYRPKETKVAEEISKRIGNITTKSYGRSFGAKSNSRSENTASKALILPQEIMDLKMDEEIILCNNIKIKCKKANYFSTPFLIEKFKLVSPTLRNINGNPGQSDYKKAIQNNELAIQLPELKAIDDDVF